MIELNEINSDALKYFAQTVTVFFFHQQKIQKYVIFDILMTVTLGVNKINDSIFSSTF